MGHFSIAIIKKQSTKSNIKDSKFDYLVIKDGSEKFKFLEQETNAMGGSFDYSGFKNFITKYLELPTTYEVSPNNFEKVDFETRPLPFKTNKRDPYATAYEYILSRIQLEHIEQMIKTKKGIWKNLIWQSEKQLLNNRKNWKNNQQFIFERETAFHPPKFSNKLRASLKNIVKARENGKLVIFAGAGVSFDSNVPGWSQLIDELKGDLDEKENDYLAIGQLYFNSRGKKEYIDKIQEVLKHGKTRYNPIHEKIVELKPLHIVTTNYDTHFEQVLDEKSYRYSIIKKDVDLPYSKGASLLIKMHGDFDEKNIVLKKEDYGDGYSSTFPLIEGFVKGVFASKLVVFIGFSFTDPNLIQILESVQNILKDDNQPPYLLMIPDQNMSKEQLKKYKEAKEKIEEKGAKIIDYEDTPFNEYFDQIISAEDETRIDELCSTGQKTYKFLKGIEQFDTFSDSLENLKIGNQLTNSILRFKGLGAIPPTVLESITPFRLKRKSKSELKTDAYYDPYNPFHLETLNENLLSFLQDKMKNGKVDFYSYSDKSLSINEQELNKALSLLYSSGIHCILRRNDTSPVHIKLNPINKNEKCNCHRCQYFRFEFDQMLQTLNTLSTKLICKNAQQDVGLIEAYGFLKTGQAARAFYVLEEIKTEAWKNQEHITYFLALYNQTLLYPFMSNLEDKTFGEDELEKIRDKIKRVDLNQAIFELPVDTPVKKTLTIIKENISFHSAQAVIEMEYPKIIENYTKYKKGGFRSMGPHYWHKVETTFYQLWKFYHRNLLFNDEYSYFLDLAHIYIESMIASFCTSQKYEQRLKHFSPFFAHVFITYGKPNELKSLLRNYEISLFEFENQKKSVDDILESFSTFCNSGFQVSSFFKDINENPLYHSAISNSTFFESKVRNSFNNFLLLIGKLKLSKKQVNIVIDEAINYLITNPIFKAHTSLQHFTSFITHYIKSVDQPNTERLINYVLSDNIWSDDLIEPICDAIINHQKRENFLGEEFYLKIIQRTENKNKWSVRLKSMIPFYSLLKQEQKAHFLKNIYPILNDSQTIIKAYNWGLWSPKKDREILNSFLEILLNECNRFPDFEIRDDGLPQEINSFSVWNDLHFIVNIIYVNDFFKEEFISDIYNSVESKMFKWILKPEEFDYSDFNISWVLPFRNKQITKVLKNIDAIKDSISIGLQENYNENVAKIYFEQLIKKR
ncbi:SIR2 family protein [Candidatus Woesearchaeota archaeon]|nr:SIR2 family protein [Candidatus Woesearchaeota archaeon]